MGAINSTMASLNYAISLHAVSFLMNNESRVIPSSPDGFVNPLVQNSARFLTKARYAAVNYDRAGRVRRSSDDPVTIVSYFIGAPNDGGSGAALNWLSVVTRLLSYIFGLFVFSHTTKKNFLKTLKAMSVIMTFSSALCCFILWILVVREALLAI